MHEPGTDRLDHYFQLHIWSHNMWLHHLQLLICARPQVAHGWVQPARVTSSSQPWHRSQRLTCMTLCWETLTAACEVKHGHNTRLHYGIQRLAVSCSSYCRLTNTHTRTQVRIKPICSHTAKTPRHTHVCDDIHSDVCTLMPAAALSARETRWAERNVEMKPCRRGRRDGGTLWCYHWLTPWSEERRPSRMMSSDTQTLSCSCFLASSWRERWRSHSVWRRKQPNIWVTLNDLCSGNN